MGYILVGSLIRLKTLVYKTNGAEYVKVYIKHNRELNPGVIPKHELPGISDLDSIIEKRTKTLIMSYIHNDEHFIHDFLEQLPSGRYRTLKYRSAWGKDCFLRAMIHSLNDIFK